MVFNWRPGRLSGSDRKIALRWDGITAHNTFCASTQRYHESATSTGSTGGSDDVSRMSWGARCQCLLTLSHMSRLRRVGVVGHFPSKLQFFLTVHKRGYVNVTHQGRQRRHSSITFLYLWQHHRGFWVCGAPFETTQTSWPICKVLCASGHDCSLCPPSLYIWVGLERREAESVTSSVTTNACVGGRRGDQTPDLNQACWCWVGGGGDTQRLEWQLRLCSCGPTWASAGTLSLLLSAPSLNHSLTVSHLSRSPFARLIWSS